MDIFLIYLIAVNVSAFTVLMIDFSLYKKKKIKLIPHAVLVVLLLAGGSAGSFIAYCICDKKIDYAVDYYEDKVTRDMILNWRVLTILLLIIHVLAALMIFELLQVDFDNCLLNSYNIVKSGIGIIGIYFIVINAVTFAAFGIDKHKSIKKKKRISIISLFVLALSGGSIGALLGMIVFNHKTNKLYFRIGVPLILIIHVMLYIIVMSNVYPG